MRSTAKRDGDEYILNGPKIFVTDGERGNIVAILAKIDPAAQPLHMEISSFIVEKNPPSFRDSKLLPVGEDTIAIQCVVIARRLLEHHKI